MLIRYCVKTQDGSYYLVEDHTHIFSKPTWKLSLAGTETSVQITNIVVPNKQILPVPNKIEGFLGHQILVNRSMGDRADQFTTSIVVEIIKFQSIR